MALETMVILFGCLCAVILCVGLAYWLFFRLFTMCPVPEQYRVAVFKRTGEFEAIKGPGAVFIRTGFPRFLAQELRGLDGQVVPDPTSERYMIDMRAKSEAVHTGYCATADQKLVAVSAIIYCAISDPERIVLKIRDAEHGFIEMTQGSFRTAVGQFNLDELLAGVVDFEGRLRSSLSLLSYLWGMKVLRFEILSLHLHPDVLSAWRQRINGQTLRDVEILRLQALVQMAELINERGKDSSFILNWEQLQTLRDRPLFAGPQPYF